MQSRTDRGLAQPSVFCFCLQICTRDLAQASVLETWAKSYFSTIIQYVMEKSSEALVSCQYLLCKYHRCSKHYCVLSQHYPKEGSSSLLTIAIVPLATVLKGSDTTYNARARAGVCAVGHGELRTAWFSKVWPATVLEHSADGNGIGAEREGGGGQHK